MSLTLLFPLGLAALAAWLLPLLLHLARREQRTPTPFAALRWLAIRAKPRQRLRLDEHVLLAVRLALVAAFALLLARPALVGGDGDAAWEVVHPSLPAPAVAGDDGRERRWLAPGFPPLEAPPGDPAVATASLLRQVDAELPAGTALTVRVPARLDGLDGERPRLSRPVQWLVEARAPAGEHDAVAVAGSVPPLAIRHDDAHADAARWLRAVAVAWSRTKDPVVDIAPADAPLPLLQGTVVAYLAAGPLPAATRAWVDAGGTLLLADDAAWPLPTAGIPLRDADGTPVADAASLGEGRVVQLRRPLRADAWPALLEPTFPQVLRALVAPPPPAPARADAAGHAPDIGGAAFAPAPREFPAPLAVLVLALFALERWLATGRRPGNPR